MLGLGDEAYGVSIIDAITSRTGRRVRSGALSVTLDRMERKGLVTLGTGKIPDDFWDLPRADDPDDLVLKALLEDREQGR